MRHRLAIVLLVLLLTSLTTSAETLRVPEDYSLIQRAAWAAAPGDTIAIAAGTFPENVVVTKSLTVQGAGPGKTILAAKERGMPVISINGQGGAIALSGVTLRHEPAAPVPPPTADSPDYEAPIPHMSDGLFMVNGDISLKNVVVENSSGQGVLLSSGKATVENLIISGATTTGATLYETLAGTTVTGLTIRDGKGDSPLSFYDAIADVKKVRIAGEGAIRVTGTKAHVTFPGIAEDLKAKIEWLDGASPNGPSKEPAASADSAPTAESSENAVSEEFVVDEYSRQRQAKRDAHQLESEPARRQLARDLEARLKDKKYAAVYAAALGVYFKDLIQTYQPAESADFGVDAAIAAEVCAYFERFGATATNDAIMTWPKFADLTENLSQMTYDAALSGAMKTGVQEARSAAWMKNNAAKLDENFAGWKAMKGKAPAEVAAVFLTGMRATGELLYGDYPPDDLPGTLRARTLKEVNLLITQAGYPVLVQLLRQIASDQNNDVFTAPELQAALTAEQKRELFKAMRTPSK